MNQKPKAYRRLCLICWLGTLIAAALLGYQLHLSARFPEAEALARNVRIAGALVLLWLPVSAFFTVRAWKEKNE